MRRLRTTLNPGLRDPLILACRVNRTVHARNVVDALRSSYGERMARATVRETIRLSEAAAARMPITQYAPDSVGSHDYRAFVDELLGESGRSGAGLQSRLRRLLTRVPRGEAPARPA
jgi:chromosome partitioning protein